MFAVSEADRPPRMVFVRLAAPFLNGPAGPRATKASRAGFTDYYGRLTTGGVRYVIVNTMTKALDGSLRRVGGLWVPEEFTGEVRARSNAAGLEGAAFEAAPAGDEVIAEPLQDDTQLTDAEPDEAVEIDDAPSDDDVTEDEAALGPLTLPTDPER